MKFKQLIPIIALPVLLYSCGNHAVQEQKITASKPNDAFRNTVLDKLALAKDSLATFDSVLNKLDDKGVAFEQYISHAFYEIDDSVSKVTTAKFQDGMTSGDKAAIEFNYQVLSTAISNYNSSLGLTKPWTDYVQYMFVSYDPIKKFCSDYMDQHKVSH